MPSRTKRRITAEDLYRFELITGVEISPDGEHVVYSLQRVERKTEKKYSSLWIVPTSGGKPTQFTYGDHSDTQPKWSPDGKTIAFLSNRRDEQQSQILLIPFDGGEARPLTNLKGSFGGFEWSPDGRRLVCMFRKKDRSELEREKDSTKKELGLVARHIKRVFYKLDGSGFLPEERFHLWVIDARTGRAKQITDSPVYDEGHPRWSPDGKRIVFCSNRSPDPDMDPDAVDLFIVSAEGGRLRKIPAPVGRKMMPSYSPDGRTIAYIGVEGRAQWWKPNGLWLVPSNGKGKARNITESVDIDVGVASMGDMVGAEQSPPIFSPDGMKVYFQVSHFGNTVVMATTTSGDYIESVIVRDGVTGSIGLDAAGRRMGCVRCVPDNPCEVKVTDLETRTWGNLTSHNERLLKSIDLGSVNDVWITGPDGNPIHGWILKPPGFRPSRKYPSILQIHGGPLMQYANNFMHEFYYLAANGYVVYFCNPRGGSGYGSEHAKAIWHNWGSSDYTDVMAFADFMEKQPYIDKKRMGVTGGSYGGYLTNWIIGHTTRFKAAVTQRCVSNLISMWGSSDFNWLFQEPFGGASPWEDVESLWAQSPMKYIGSAKTPTLVIHSEQDLRCSIEQGEQVFVALKRLGVDTEFVRFPDEPHGLSRGGRTDRRIERLNHILRWFDKHLKGKSMKE